MDVASVTTSLILEETSTSRQRKRAEGKLPDFLRGAERSLARHRLEMALAYARAEARAAEREAAHELRKLLQPLLLRADLLSTDDRDTVADGIRDSIHAMNRWISENLEQGRLAERLRAAASGGGDTSEVPEVLATVLNQDPYEALTVDVPDDLPALDVTPSVLTPALRELLGLVRPGPARIEATPLSPASSRSVRLRLVREAPLQKTAPTAPAREEGQFPPVAGALLNLLTTARGVLDLEVRDGRGLQATVRLPAVSASPS